MLLILTIKIETATTPTSPKEVLISVPIEKSCSAVEITVKSATNDDIASIDRQVEPNETTTTTNATQNVTKEAEQPVVIEPVAVESKSVSPPKSNTSLLEPVNDQQLRIKDSTSSTCSSTASTKTNATVTTTTTTVRADSTGSSDDNNAPPPRIFEESSLDKSTTVTTPTTPTTKTVETSSKSETASPKSEHPQHSRITRNAFNSSSQKSTSSVVKSASNHHHPKSNRYQNQSSSNKSFTIKDYALYAPSHRYSQQEATTTAAAAAAGANVTTTTPPTTGGGTISSGNTNKTFNRWMSLASSETSSDRNSSLEDFATVTTSTTNLSKSNQNIASSSYNVNNNNNNRANPHVKSK